MIAKYHCPNPIEVLISVDKNRHEKSLLGKHASLEGKLYFQEENVTEADKVNPHGESEIPICTNPPTIAKRWGDLLWRDLFYSSAPQLTPIFVSRRMWESVKHQRLKSLACRFPKLGATLGQIDSCPSQLSLLFWLD
jgi:hypothetical protein